MESWDDENFEPELNAAPKTQPLIATNKWEGEDEEDDVKESWEDEDEEKPVEQPQLAPPPPPKKVTLVEKIAERERIKREAKEKLLKELEEEEKLTPEEQLRKQHESDLKLALETTFDSCNTAVPAQQTVILNSSLPERKDDYPAFVDNIVQKLLPLTKQPDYPVFVESLVRGLCASLSSLDLKSIKNTTDNLYLEKQKVERGEKSKKSKGRTKAKLHLDGNLMSDYVTNTYEEFDDFM